MQYKLSEDSWLFPPEKFCQKIDFTTKNIKHHLPEEAVNTKLLWSPDWEYFTPKLAGYKCFYSHFSPLSCCLGLFLTSQRVLLISKGVQKGLLLVFFFLHKCSPGHVTHSWGFGQALCTYKHLISQDTKQNLNRGFSTQLFNHKVIELRSGVEFAHPSSQGFPSLSSQKWFLCFSQSMISAPWISKCI